MKENIKRDYLRYLFNRTRSGLMRYNISNTDSELIKNLFEKISRSENLTTELYILFNIREFRNLSKYFIFITKKIEDNVINFDNLLQNLRSDSEYIENEILMYLSNPTPKEILDLKFPEEKRESSIEITGIEEILTDEKIYEDLINEKEPPEEEEEKSEFTRNFLELIQSEETNQEIAYELPLSEKQGDDSQNINEHENGIIESAFDLPDESLIEPAVIETEQSADSDIEVPFSESAEDSFDKDSNSEILIPEEIEETPEKDKSESESTENAENEYEEIEERTDEGQQEPDEGKPAVKKKIQRKFKSKNQVHSRKTRGLN